MRSFVTSKNVKWRHLIWPTLYMQYLIDTDNDISLLGRTLPFWRWTTPRGPNNVSAMVAALF